MVEYGPTKDFIHKFPNSIALTPPSRTVAGSEKAFDFWLYRHFSVFPFTLDPNEVQHPKQFANSPYNGIHTSYRPYVVGTVKESPSVMQLARHGSLQFQRGAKPYGQTRQA